VDQGIETAGKGYGYKIMPLPFHCVECDKPILIMQGGLCDECSDDEEE